MMHGGGMGGCRSGGCPCGGGVRKFLTKKEHMEKMENYLKELEKEIVGVKEHIEMMKKHEKGVC